MVAFREGKDAAAEDVMRGGTFSDGSWIVITGLVILIVLVIGGDFERTLFDLRMSLGLN